MYTTLEGPCSTGSSTFVLLIFLSNPVARQASSHQIIFNLSKDPHQFAQDTH